MRPDGALPPFTGLMTRDRGARARCPLQPTRPAPKRSCSPYLPFSAPASLHPDGLPR